MSFLQDKLIIPNTVNCDFPGESGSASIKLKLSSALLRSPSNCSPPPCLYTVLQLPGGPHPHHWGLEVFGPGVEPVLQFCCPYHHPLHDLSIKALLEHSLDLDVKGVRVPHLALVLQNNYVLYCMVLCMYSIIVLHYAIKIKMVWTNTQSEVSQFSSSSNSWVPGTDIFLAFYLFFIRDKLSFCQ